VVVSIIRQGLHGPLEDQILTFNFRELCILSLTLEIASTVLGPEHWLPKARTVGERDPKSELIGLSRHTPDKYKI